MKRVTDEFCQLLLTGLFIVALATIAYCLVGIVKAETMPDGTPIEEPAEPDYITPAPPPLCLYADGWGPCGDEINKSYKQLYEELLPKYCAAYETVAQLWWMLFQEDFEVHYPRSLECLELAL